MKRSKRSIAKRLCSVSLLVMDVDGTMTDGDVYHKRFDAHDGYGLARLRKLKAIISGYDDQIIYKRAEQLGIDFVMTGIDNKPKALDQLLKRLQIGYEKVCYIGDDLNDLECIKKAGVGVAVRDAVKEVRKAADYITKNKGGHGAIRELTDMMESCYECCYVKAYHNARNRASQNWSDREGS